MSGPRLVSDVKVAVDDAATPDYLGNSSSTGALRTGGTISYTDGGNYVTLAVNEASAFAWTNTHTWGVSGTGVNLSAYSDVAGDDMHWVKNGASGGGGMLSLDGGAELEVVGKAAFGGAVMGGTYGNTLISARTTLDPEDGETEACIEFIATLDTDGTLNGFYGFQMQVITSGTVSSLQEFAAFDAFVQGTHTTGTSTRATCFNASMDFPAVTGTTTRAASFRANVPGATGGHTITHYYGLYIPSTPTAATNNWNVWFNGGNSHFGGDNAQTKWGTGDDAFLYYDGSNFICSVASVTSGSSFVVKDAGIIWNDDGGDKDTRGEGDTLTHMFFMDASAATENIALIATGAPNWQSMDRGLFLGDTSAAPTGNPTSGIFIWSESGAGKARGTSGTVTTWAPAEPHCPVCGMDFIHEWENETKGKYLAVCMNCLTEELGDRPYIMRRKATA